MLNAKVSSYSGGANPCGIGGEITLHESVGGEDDCNHGAYYSEAVVLRALNGDAAVIDYIRRMHNIRATGSAEVERIELPPTGDLGVPKLYRGQKTLKAWPMTRGAYNFYRGWGNPEGENADEPGYLVEYTNELGTGPMIGDTRNHPMHDGYISWSPAFIFAQIYREA